VEKKTRVANLAKERRFSAAVLVFSAGKTGRFSATLAKFATVGFYRRRLQAIDEYHSK
jgi:hypothetical protein